MKTVSVSTAGFVREETLILLGTALGRKTGNISQESGSSHNRRWISTEFPWSADLITKIFN